MQRVRLLLPEDPRRGLLLSLACAGLLGCPEPCREVWGDLGLAPTLWPTQRMPDGGAQVLERGGPLYLQVPVQGGHVAYVGAQVQNFEGCRVELEAVLLGADGGPRATEERRRVDLTFSGMSDPVEPANFANVPVCPNFGAVDFPGVRYRLEVAVTQRDGRRVSQALEVVPSCAHGGPECECECRAGYEFGKCGRDGG